MDTSPMLPATPQLSKDEIAGAEILQTLRAQTEAESELEQLRESARLEGEHAYRTGPGRKRGRDWESLPETDPVFRREKKTRSAYVSRFKAAAYKRLLEDKVGDIVRANETKRADLAHRMLEHSMLKEEVRILREQLARKSAAAPPPPAPEQVRQDEEEEEEEELEELQIPVKIPLSPVSPGSSVLSAPMHDVPYPDVIALDQDPFALLPPSYTKMYPIEEWTSSAETDDVQGHFLFAQ